jgi:hypothetical protein
LAKTVFQSLRRIEEMKKLIAIFAVLLFAVPAIAADWEFYGSQRVATFYRADDYGDFEQGQVFNTSGVQTTAGNGESDDWGLQWQFQDNSRLGAKVKADKVKGQIELALNASSGNGGDANRGSNGGDGSVTTRRAWGEWKFSENASLKVGKDYSPTSNLVSGQVFDFDAGLLGQGDFYGRRPAGLTLNLGAFELALLTNALNNGMLPSSGVDPDWNLPKIEARYTLKMSGFELIPFGGFQYFQLSSTNSPTVTSDLDIYSYVGGLVAKVDIGAFYIAAEGAYGQNWSNANWQAGRSTTARGFVSGFNAASASLKGTDDVNDATSWMAMGLVGLKFTDTLKFEAGFGYRSDDPDIDGVDPLEAWEAYLQAVITMAPGVYLIPEVGYIDYMDAKIDNNSNDLGYSWYAGAKWQIDF